MASIFHSIEAIFSSHHSLRLSTFLYALSRCCDLVLKTYFRFYGHLWELCVIGYFCQLDFLVRPIVQSRGTHSYFLFHRFQCCDILTGDHAFTKLATSKASLRNLGRLWETFLYCDRYFLNRLVNWFFEQIRLDSWVQFYGSLPWSLDQSTLSTSILIHQP